MNIFGRWSPAFNLFEPEPEPEPEPVIIPQGEQSYTAVLTMTEDLTPETVVKENFTLTSNGEALEVEEAIYKPQNKTVLLELAPVELANPNCSLAVKNVTHLFSGLSAAGEISFESLYRNFDCDMFGLNVRSMRLYQSRVQVTQLVAGQPFRVEVEVANTSGNAKSGTVQVYFDSTPDEILSTKEISLSAGEKRTFYFNIDGVSETQTGTIFAEVV